MDKISERIKILRKQNKISQLEMAEKIGLQHQSNYARFENRGKKLSFEELGKISEALGVSVKYLLFGEEESQSNSNDNRVRDLEKENALLKEKEGLYKKILKDAVYNLLNGLITTSIKYAMFVEGEIKDYIFYGEDVDGKQNIHYLPKLYDYFHSVLNQWRDNVKKGKRDEDEKFRIYKRYIFHEIQGFDLDSLIDNNLIEDHFIITIYKEYKQDIKSENETLKLILGNAFDQEK